MATQCHTEYAVQKKAQLENSLLNLMLRQPYKEISVTDICREADIPRRTFYHYFESKDDVLDSMIETLMQQCFLSSVYGLHVSPAHMKDGFVRIFRFWDGDNRVRLDALIRNGLESRLMTWSLNFIRAKKIGILNNSNLNPKLVEIGLMVGVTDFFSLLFYWSRDGYQETAEQMAEYAIWVLPQAFYNL
jgi:AcrR family transcriptional regulator